MPQNENARPLFGNPIPPIHRDNLIAWSRMDVLGGYTESETKLFRMAALGYADPSRPSIRDLYRMLCEMIDRDEAHGSAEASRVPFATFRRLVLSLPGDFIDQQRYGVRLTSRNISMTAEQVMDDICSKRSDARI